MVQKTVPNLLQTGFFRLIFFYCKLTLTCNSKKCHLRRGFGCWPCTADRRVPLLLSGQQNQEGGPVRLAAQQESMAITTVRRSRRACRPQGLTGGGGGEDHTPAA